MENYDFGAFGKFNKNAIDGKKRKKAQITQSRILPISNVML